MFSISKDFPDPRRAQPDGFLCAGGRMDADSLTQAYQLGIFPWPNENADSIWWFSPRKRFVLTTDQFHLPKSLARTMRQHPFEIRVDTAFADVIQACSNILRPVKEGQPGSPKKHSTWLLPDMIPAYVELHKRGLAHSIEAYQNDQLVGGLYGVSVGALFCGESMFRTVDDASKVAFATFVPIARSFGIPLIDCQDFTNNLSRFGASFMPQDVFLNQLEELKNHPMDWKAIKAAVEATNIEKQPQ